MEFKVTQRLIIFGCLITLPFCQNKGNEKTLSKIDGPNDFDRGIQVEKIPDKYFYSFINESDSTYKVVWGNDSSRFVSDKKFEVLGSGKLEYLTADESVIILSQSCGTSCVYFVMFFLNGDISEYYNIKALNLDYNLVAYTPIDKDVLLIVRDFYKKRNIREIKESNLCSAAFKGDCITGCFFKKDSLILNADDSTNNHSIRRTYFIDSSW